MIKSLFRICPSIISTHTSRQSVFNTKKLPNSRQWCTLTQQDPPMANAIEMFINYPRQDDLQEDESDQNALGKPKRRRRQLRHPQTLSEAVLRSQFLRQMVFMGVNLYEIQKRRPLDFDFIVSLRIWDPDPPERIRYLLQLGVPEDSIPKIITANPRILKTSIDDMQIRVNYLESKKFLPEDIAKIVAGCPKFLTMITEETDSRLGYFQQGFKLSGNQVRHLAITYPWMISWSQKKLRDTLDTLSDKLSFSITHMKHLILHHGYIWKTDADDVKLTAEFLHKELKMSHAKMVEFGHLLSKNRRGMKYRYDFMVYMKRVNFDPTKPYYNSYDILWQGDLEDFCKKLNTNMEALDLFAKSV